MIQLIYGSTAVNPFTSDQLVELLKAARQKNERLNVTGMLLYYDSSFIQVLEGEAEAVDSLFETIKSDDRHEAVTRFFRRETAVREFPEWEMAFREITDADIAKVPGYSEVLKQHTLNASYFADHPSYARTFLGAFMQNLR
jgi:hypothetical protein